MSQAILTERYTLGLLLFCFAMVIAGGMFAFPLSYLTKINVLIGFCLFPFALSFEGRDRFNYIYFLVATIFGALAFIYHVRIFYFFFVSFFILFFLELLVGSINQIIVFLVMLMSPFLEQVFVILGFAFRLKLSEFAGQILAWIGMNVQVEGNTILLDGTLFAVDDACAGLNMLTLSMLMALFIITFHMRMLRVKLPFLVFVLFFSSTFLLNVVANLFRVILLVLFRILPDNPMHEAIGVLCLVSYVILPTWVFAKWLSKKKGLPLQANLTSPSSGLFKTVLLFTFGAAILFTGIHLDHKRELDNMNHARVSYAPYKSEALRDGITRILGDDVLIYVKPIKEFFSGEHTPLLCWKGSGYKFEAVKQTRVAGYPVYTGKLVRDDEVLYTAWWYTNGKDHSIEQIDWRMRMLKGEDRFCLINVTTDSPRKLNAELEMILEKNGFVITHSQYED
jgi:exosortase N